MSDTLINSGNPWDDTSLRALSDGVFGSDAPPFTLGVSLHEVAETLKRSELETQKKAFELASQKAHLMNIKQTEPEAYQKAKAFFDMPLPNGLEVAIADNLLNYLVFTLIGRPDLDRRYEATLLCRLAKEGYSVDAMTGLVSGDTCSYALVHRLIHCHPKSHLGLLAQPFFSIYFDIPVKLLNPYFATFAATAKGIDELVFRTETIYHFYNKERLINGKPYWSYQLPLAMHVGYYDEQNEARGRVISPWEAFDPTAFTQRIHAGVSVKDFALEQGRTSLSILLQISETMNLYDGMHESWWNPEPEEEGEGEENINDLTLLKKIGMQAPSKPLNRILTEEELEHIVFLVKDWETIKL